MNKTTIGWCDFSANPLKYRTVDGRVVWACEKVSAGCANCYAEALSHRYGGIRRAGDWNAATMAGLTPFLDEAELKRMLTLKAASGKRVFLGDMTDVFGAWVPERLLNDIFAVMALRRSVTWQVLTKRADRMLAYFTDGERRDAVLRRMIELAGGFDGRPEGGWLQEAFIVEELFAKGRLWPLPNVWLGVSAENQEQADARIPPLLKTPAAVRFVSAEPLLGPITFRRGQLGVTSDCDECRVRRVSVDEDGCCQSCGSDVVRFGLDWVIVGGESGPAARPCRSEWIRAVVAQCVAEETACFVKQIGSHVLCRNDVGYEGDTSDGWPMDTTYETTTPENWQGDDVRVRLKDRKGGDPVEWPQALRVRQFPCEDR